jgi:hypothetical protein
MNDKPSKPVYVGDEQGAPIPAWWLGCATLITVTLCILLVFWIIIRYLP